MMNPRVVRAHERHAAFAPEAPDHLPDTSLDDLDQRAFAAAVAIHLHHPGHHAIAVHQRTHLAGREEQIGARIVGPDEPEPVAVPDDAPGDEIHPIDEPELPAPVANDLAVALHRVQPPLQCFVRVRGLKRVRTGDQGERDGCAALREELDQRSAFREVRDTCTGAASSLTARRWRAR